MKRPDEIPPNNSEPANDQDQLKEIVKSDRNAEHLFLELSMEYLPRDAITWRDYEAKIKSVDGKIPEGIQRGTLCIPSLAKIRLQCKLFIHSCHSEV
ncbi:MAG TPA: hypothetical protein VJI73_00255 [Candidatus Paceibacterota bacterium]